MHKHRQQQGHGRQAARKNRDGSVPGRNANGDDILTADDRAALEIVLEDQDRAKLEPAERLERHFRAGHFILRGDTYATLKSNGHMGKVYARAAAEWIRASGIDRHPLLRRRGTRTNLRHMAKQEAGIRFWWEHLDIDDQAKFGHPDTIWDKYRSFLSAIFTAAGFWSVEALDDAVFIVPEDEDEDRPGDEPEESDEEETGGEQPVIRLIVGNEPKEPDEEEVDADESGVEPPKRGPRPPQQPTRSPIVVVVSTVDAAAVTATVSARKTIELIKSNLTRLDGEPDLVDGLTEHCLEAANDWRAAANLVRSRSSNKRGHITLVTDDETDPEPPKPKPRN